MKKSIAVAALLAATFAVAPTAPVQAESSYPAKCLILPLLQADCRAEISNRIDGAADATVTVAAAAEDAAVAIKLPAPWGMSCTAAPAGSGHLYDCE